MRWADGERRLPDIDQRAKQNRQLLCMRYQFLGSSFATRELHGSFNSGGRTRFTHTLPEGITFTPRADSHVGRRPKQQEELISQQHECPAKLRSTASLPRSEHDRQTRYPIEAHG